MENQPVSWIFVAEIEQRTECELLSLARNVALSYSLNLGKYAVADGPLFALESNWEDFQPETAGK